ncbi:MAG: alpha/beta fold hydrolase [Pseudomonadota bacterium]
MGLVSIGEAELWTESYGDGEPLLLVAGLGGTGAFWQQQIPLLAKRYQVIVHDHRGVGRSTPAPIIDGARHMAADVEALMDALEIERAHVVGHSTGGAIGQHLALNCPQRIASLVLSASWGGPTPLFIDTFHLRREVLINLGTRAYLMLGSLLAMPGPHLAAGYQGSDVFLKDRIANFPGLEVELARLNAVMSHDLRHRLGDISVPTGVISAADDVLTTQPMSDELAERIPGARQVLLAQCGHFCPVTNTGPYNEALLKLLAELS